MKTREVTAYIGTGSDKKLAGSTTINQPETLDEAVEVFGSVESFIDLAMRSKVIEVQNTLRNPPKSAKTENEKKFAKMSKERQDELLALLNA
jgi:hypothetical protein